MTEEVKNQEIKNECFCKKRAKDVLTIAIGSFVGVYCALSLFTALHRPHFPHHPMMYPGMYKGWMKMDYKKIHDMEKFRPDKFKPDFDKQKPAENVE